ncbi:M56 family metallopeptidase [uncultured Jatrophihabitans sp.]|uniref:M56 family metallopeptidase n=1 Tax=uncultured Jatrophihabitans sp. TaxID=1610747 RepID=UPI0035CB1596
MTSAVWIAVAGVPVLISVGLGALAPALAHQSSPPWAARLLVGLALVAALATGLALCALAVLGIGQIPSAGRFGGWSADAISDSTPVPGVVGIIAGLVAVALLVRAGTHAVRALARLRSAIIDSRGLTAAADGIVVVDDPQTTRAYSVPGRPGRIVATSGLLALLDHDERRAVVAHERAHLRHYHVGYVQFAELAAAANPLLHRVARTVRQVVETWADAESVAEVGDPMCVARALAKATLGPASAAPAGAALAIAEDSDITVRVRALLDPPRRRTRRWVTAALLSAILCTAGSGVLALRAHQDVETAQWQFVHTTR